MNTNEKLDEIVQTAMASQLRGTTDTQAVKFASIDEYKQVTGKRFRMTKEQITRGISREDAFQEFLKTEGK